MSCTKIGDFCKTPAERVPLRIPVRGSAFILTWAKNEIVALGNCRRPKAQNGWEYEVTVAGQCGSDEPEWPTTPGQTVQDGGVTWSCKAVSNDTVRVLSSCQWLGDTLTIDDDQIVNTDGEIEVSAYASGGTVDDAGTVTARLTFSDGSIEDAQLGYTVH